jgi:putative flippase GtrA
MPELEIQSARETPAVVRASASVLLDQRIKHLLAGGMTAGVYYILLGLGLLAAKNVVPYLLVVVISHFITSVIVYPVYRLAIFKVASEGWLSGCLRFYAVGLTFLGASVVGLPFLVEFAGIPIMVAQALIILLSPPLSYVIHRTWTFRERGNI